MSPEAVAPPQPEKAVPQRVFRLPREIGILGALGLMLLVLAIFIPQFRDLQNITNITRNFSFVGIVAMGMTLVILTGGIDLSGSTCSKRLKPSGRFISPMRSMPKPSGS